MAVPGLWDELNAWRQAVTSDKCELRPLTRLVLLVLAIYANPRELTCFPSEVTLAARTGLSERSIRNHLNYADQSGWITRTRVKGEWRAWFHIEYELKLPPSHAARDAGSCRLRRQVTPEQPESKGAGARNEVPFKDLRELIKENRTSHKNGLREGRAEKDENPQSTAKLLATQLQDPEIEYVYLECVSRIGVLATRRAVHTLFTSAGLPAADVLKQALKVAA